MLGVSVNNDQLFFPIDMLSEKIIFNKYVSLHNKALNRVLFPYKINLFIKLQSDF